MTLQQDRSRVLEALYDAVGGQPKHRDVNFRSLATAAGLTPEQNQAAVDWLVDHGFAEWTALGGSLGITRKGSDAVERAQSEEQAEAESTVVEVAAAHEVQAVEKVLTILRRVEDDLELTDEQAAVLDAERTTMEAQIRSPRPNRRVLRYALLGLGWVASAVGSEVLGGAVVEALNLFPSS